MIALSDCGDNIPLRRGRPISRNICRPLVSSPTTRPSAFAAEAPPVYRRSVFYGWWIVAANVAILTLVSDTGFYGLGVFLP